MKNAIILTILFFSSHSWSATTLTMDDVATKVKSQNLSVLQNAEKVYQAKLSIDEARLNLLPKLNLWNLGKAFIDPTGLLDIVQDIAPFLVPANWFRLKETEILYKAEREGLRALQANEVYAARSLYLKVLMDQEMYNSLKRHHAELSTIKSLAEDRLELGMEKPELVREIQIQHLKINEDVEQLKLLVNYEKNILNQTLGFPIGEELTLAQVNFSNEQLKPIDPTEWEVVALNNSPEVKQYVHFINVLPKIKKEIYFSFLGVPSLSRGTAGGIFDHLPVSQGLGFANSKQVAIVSSQGKILKLQKKGVEETIKRQILNVSQVHNSALNLYASQKERLKLSELNFESLKQKIGFGTNVSLAEVSATLLSLSQSRASYSEATYRFVMNYDMLSRLSLTGVYAETKVKQK